MLLVGGLQINFHLLGTPPAHLGLVAVTRRRQFAEVSDSPVNDSLLCGNACDGPLQTRQHFFGIPIGGGFINAPMLRDTFSQPLLHQRTGPSVLSDQTRLFKFRQQPAMLQRVVTNHVFPLVELDEEATKCFLCGALPRCSCA